MYQNITTVQAAYASEGLDYAAMHQPLTDIPDDIARGMVALMDATVVVRAINNDDKSQPSFVPDFNDDSQKKWGPWTYGGSGDGSGSGFSLGGTDWTFTGTFTVGGARLALRDKARADHMWGYFSFLYKELWLVLKGEWLTQNKSDEQKIATILGEAQDHFDESVEPLVCQKEGGEPFTANNIDEATAYFKEGESL